MTNEQAAAIIDRCSPRDLEKVMDLVRSGVKALRDQGDTVEMIAAAFPVLVRTAVEYLSDAAGLVPA
jgi:hypothetical protein